MCICQYMHYICRNSMLAVAILPSIARICVYTFVHIPCIYISSYIYICIYTHVGSGNFTLEYAHICVYTYIYIYVLCTICKYM